jgi:hypothetical protein
MTALEASNAAARLTKSTSWLARALLFLVVGAAVAFVIVEIAGLSDLYSFELPAILQLVGLRGITLILAVNVGLLALAVRGIYALRKRPPPFPRTLSAVLVLGALLALRAYDCVFMGHPITQRLVLLVRSDKPLVLDREAQRDFSSFSIVRGTTNTKSIERLRVMYERTRINNPAIYALHPIGSTIDKYAARYGIDPAVLFFLNYIDSWYGESGPGPVPFLRAMSPETVRDFVQTHLPAWFVESGLRRALIATPLFDHLFGQELGFKLRYAFHKATLDVSISPYALNTYSDIFLVLREYPEAFPEIFANPNGDPLNAAVFDSFRKLRASALVSPYERPYSRAAYGESYYGTNRENLKRFTRAVFYLTLLNFDFATRVQALLSKYEHDYYIARLGADNWGQIPAWQQAAMLVMIRDLYSGNVGHTGYNVYALPELNCTPIEWVSSAAIAEGGLPHHDTDKLWRPRHYEYLWAGAGYRLRVFSDVWSLAHGRAFPGIIAEDTVDDARRIVLIVTGR